jgi:hypothetical protein
MNKTNQIYTEYQKQKALKEYEKLWKELETEKDPKIALEKLKKAWKIDDQISEYEQTKKYF